MVTKEVIFVAYVKLAKKIFKVLTTRKVIWNYVR